MVAKTLLLLRHAKSSWKDASLSDHDRPLNGRGKRAAPRMGELLVEQGLQPDLVLSSTAVRARATAEAVMRAAGLTCPLQLLEELYLAPPQVYLNTLCQQSDSYQRILVVGHNPSLEDLVALLVGAHERLPTATLVQIELEVGTWRDLPATSCGRLCGIWRPREL